MVTVDPKRLARLEKLVIRTGSHPSFQAGACVMEVSAWLAGERHSDRPECVCPVIGAFLRRWNDGIRDDARRSELLRPLALEVLDTRSTPEVERKRAYFAVDWSVRINTPAFLDLVPKLNEHATALRELGPIVDKASAEMAQLAIARARSASASASAYASASYAASASASAVAASAVAASAYVADDDARSRLSETVTQQQLSAVDLVRQMIAVQP